MGNQNKGIEPVTRIATELNPQSQIRVEIFNCGVSQLLVSLLRYEEIRKTECVHNGYAQCHIIILFGP